MLIEEIADQMAGYAVQVAISINPVTNGETSIATDPLVRIPAELVDTFVSSDGLTIGNRTEAARVVR